MIALIATIAIIYWIIQRFGEEAGAIAILVAAILFLILFCAAWREDNKAYVNRRMYWARGGPDRRE